MKSPIATILMCMVAMAGCARKNAPAQRDRALLSEDQRAANVKSFDQIWTTIRDKHWDPQLAGVDWEAARAELRPKVEQSKNMHEAREAMEELIEKLHQSHFGIIPREVYRDVTASANSSDPKTKTSEGATGLDVRVMEGQAVVTRVHPDTPAADAGVRNGWIITRIQQRKLRAILDQVARSYETSSLREAYLRAAVMGQLSGNAGEVRTVTFLDDRNRKIVRTLTLATPPGTPAKLGHLPTFFVTFDAQRLPSNIGYIALSAFFDPALVMTKFEEAAMQFRDAEGIILDLRGNPGGIGGMAMGMGGFFVSESGQKLGTMITRGGKLNFVLNPRAVTFDGPLAILVDGNSMSTSEILAGGLQDLKRARVFGSKTPGMALPSVVVMLPNGDGFQYAIANYVSTGGEPLEARGVTPDETVNRDRASLLAGEDPVITAAVRWIQSQKK